MAEESSTGCFKLHQRFTCERKEKNPRKRHAKEKSFEGVSVQDEK